MERLCRGNLWYPEEDFDGKGHTCGTVKCSWACSAFAEASPPFVVNPGLPIVAMIDRVPGEILFSETVA
jgi:hypothetical protein